MNIILINYNYESLHLWDKMDHQCLMQHMTFLIMCDLHTIETPGQTFGLSKYGDVV